MDMDNELVWTAEAKDMLMQIFDGIANDNPSMATNVIRSIFAKTQALLISPEKGWPLENIPNRNVRFILYGHYRIAYEIHATGYIVIFGVFIAPSWSELAACGTILQQHVHYDEVPL